MKGRTSFIIAHRLSTIQEADKTLFSKMAKSSSKEITNLLADKGFY